jgi:hypothetical protein
MKYSPLRVVELCLYILIIIAALIWLASPKAPKAMPPVKASMSAFLSCESDKHGYEALYSGKCNLNNPTDMMFMPAVTASVTYEMSLIHETYVTFDERA